MDTLLVQLQARKAPGETDQQFAARLGLSQPHWSMILSGDRRIGTDAAARIVRIFPELWMAVADYLLGDDNGSKS